ncbi:MAG: uroporphyrinogen decarboxylase family protein [Pseudomonadota bacterium]
MEITPKQRILTSLEHREPDRVPYDLGGTVDTSIHYMCYNNLVRHLGKEHLARQEQKVHFMDIVQGVVQVDPEMVERLKVDVRGFVPGSYKVGWTETVQSDGTDYYVLDSFGARWFRPKHGFYFDQKEGSFPLAKIDSVPELERFNWPVLGDEDRVKGIRDIAQELGRQYALVAGDPVGGIFAQSFRLRGYTNFYLDLAGNPDFALALMNKLTEIKMQYWDRVLDEVGDLIDIVIFEDDLGEQKRTLISPQMYRQLVKPCHARLFSFIKKKTHGRVYVLLHTDGSVYDLIPDLIEAGIDILNPIQVSCANMDSAKLKKEFGRDLVFWGGSVDTQGVLSQGRPEQVRDEVKRRLDDLAPGGGFVFAAIHNVQPEVPPENFMAMWETLQKYGGY